IRNAKPAHGIRRARLPQPHWLLLSCELLAGKASLAAGNPPAGGGSHGSLDLARGVSLSPVAGRLSGERLDRVRHRVVRHPSLSVGRAGTRDCGYRRRPPLTVDGWGPANHFPAPDLRQTLSAAAQHPVLLPAGR